MICKTFTVPIERILHWLCWPDFTSSATSNFSLTQWKISVSTQRIGTTFCTENVFYWRHRIDICYVSEMSSKLLEWFWSDIHGLQRMNLNDFDDLSTLHLTSSSAQNFNLYNTLVYGLQNDIPINLSFVLSLVLIKNVKIANTKLR